MVLRAPYSATAIEKGLMLFAVELVILRKQESVSLETTKTTASAVILESDSAWRGSQMVPSDVELQHETMRIMAKSTLTHLDTS